MDVPAIEEACVDRFVTRQRNVDAGAMPSAPEPLLEHLDAFLGFVRRRTGDPDLSAEVVQEALSKALAHQDAVRDADRLLPWFWRILRNTLADVLAQRGRTSQRVDDLASAPADERGSICACLLEALPTLPDRQRQAIERVDLAAEDPAVVAASLGISETNLKVIRHRARAALRERLDAICRTCATHGCLDCDCSDHEHGVTTPQA